MTDAALEERRKIYMKEQCDIQDVNWTTSEDSIIGCADIDTAFYKKEVEKLQEEVAKLKGKLEEIAQPCRKDEV
jgi:hypothetical protein